MSDIVTYDTSSVLIGVAAVFFVLLVGLGALIFFLLNPSTPVPPIGVIIPNNQNVVGWSPTGNVFYQNGEAESNSTRAACESVPTQYWDPNTGTCECINGFYNERCNYEAYSSKYFDMGQVTVGGSSSTITMPSTTKTISSTADFLTFNPTGNGRDTFRTFSTSCTGQCDANPDCVGVIFDNNSISPITAPTTPNPCTLILGSFTVNTAPPYNTEGPAVKGEATITDNLFVKSDQYVFDMKFPNQMFFSANKTDMAFPVRYWLAPANKTFVPTTASAASTFEVPVTTPTYTAPFLTQQFISTNATVAVFYRDAATFNANKSRPLSEIYNIYKTSGQATLVAQGIYLLLPWVDDISLMAAAPVFGTATSPAYIRVVARPSFIPSP